MGKRERKRSQVVWREAEPSLDLLLCCYSFYCSPKLVFICLRQGLAMSNWSSSCLGLFHALPSQKFSAQILPLRHLGLQIPEVM
jgi:hypothetical protein